MIVSHEHTHHDYLPTPPVQFWQAWLVVRNYLLMYHGFDIFAKSNFNTFVRDGVEYKQRYDLLTAFWMMDYHFDVFLAAEAASGTVD